MTTQTMANRRPVEVKQLPEKLNRQHGRTFFRELEACLNSDRPRLVLDCSKLQHLDSAGIQVLLRCLEEAMKRNGDVKLAALPARATATLELTGVNRLFESFDTTTEAVLSFQQLPVYGFQHALGLAYSAPAPLQAPPPNPWHPNTPPPLPKVPRSRHFFTNSNELNIKQFRHCRKKFVGIHDRVHSFLVDWKQSRIVTLARPSFGQ